MKTNGLPLRRTWFVSFLILSIARAVGDEAPIEITSTPKIGDTITWVMRSTPRRVSVQEIDPDAPREGGGSKSRLIPYYIRFYQVERKDRVTLTSGNSTEPRQFMGIDRGWEIRHADIPKLSEFLNTFADWSEAARKKRVKSVYKVIGELPKSGDRLTFLVGQDQGVTKQYLGIERQYHRNRVMSPKDVSMIQELVEKLPSVDEQITGGNPAIEPKPANDLFKKSGS